MIILSYNSRGLGRGIKWTAIKRLNLKHKVDLVCIQETKKEFVDKLICQSIWGDSSVSWDFVPSVQARMMMMMKMLQVNNNHSFGRSVHKVKRETHT